MRQSDLCVNSANEQVCTVLQCFLVSLEPTSALLNGVFPRIFTSQSDYTGEIIFERKSKAEELTSYCCCVASVVSDSVRPQRRQPTRLPGPWDSPGKNTGVGCHFLLRCMKVKSESEVAQSCQHSVTPWTAAYQASPSMGYSRQEYWSGLPLTSPKESQRVGHN